LWTGTTDYAQAILDLASRPQYVGELREEVETMAAEEGEQNEDGNIYLGKAAFAKMKKLDSFIKESQRFNSLAFGMRESCNLEAPSLTAIQSHLPTNC
jgi:predicted transcriptional regulator of viral defense system